MVHIRIQIETATFTHTTASGLMEITNVPYTAGGAVANGPLTFEGITKASYTNFTLYSASAFTGISASGSGQARALITAADMPSAGEVLIFADISFRI
jgi:hypothetical protein